MIDKEKFIKIARSWLGTKWQHDQQIKGVGVDCVNFLMAVAIEYGCDLPLIPKNYNRISRNNEIVDYIADNFQILYSKDQGDLNLMDSTDIAIFKVSGYSTHVGIITAPYTIIHSENRVGKVIEHNLDGVWLRKLHSIWRFR
jgi:cell wall-associated NlpC family hydrolase